MHPSIPERDSGARGRRRIFRFAPSPNGFLHLGHAFSALLNARAAERSLGGFLLRIEDIDAARSRADLTAAILADLAWLGLSWDEPVLRQSERFDAYGRALAELRRSGLLYPSFLTRTEIAGLVAEAERSGRPWPRDPDGAPHYPGPERDWSETRLRAEEAGGRPFALRLRMAEALRAAPPLDWLERPFLPDLPPQPVPADPAAWGDVVLARKDTPASYHLSVVIDDAAQGVSDVVRGADLRAATSVHRMLQVLLGLPQPVYFHHALILDAAGQKLAKSRGSASLRDLRREGATAASLLARLEPDLAGACA